MAIPTWVSESKVSGAGAVTPGLPAGAQADDILLLVIEAYANDATPSAAPTGGEWTAVNDPGDGSIASDTGVVGDEAKITAYWHRYNGVDDPNRVVPDAGAQTGAYLTAYRGCETTGTPVHAVQSTANGTPTTAGSAAGPTTTVDDCLIVIALGYGDNATSSFGSEANANLSDLTFRNRNEHTIGTDGGVTMLDGGLATAGAAGTTTISFGGNVKQAHWVIALMEPQPLGGGAIPDTGGAQRLVRGMAHGMVKGVAQ